MDHFIPFAFLFDHPAWDLVASCKDCNRGIKTGKFEKLPNRDKNLVKLHERNEQLFIKNKELFASFSSIDEIREFTEKQYEICSNAGFKLWK